MFINIYMYAELDQSSRDAAVVEKENWGLIRALILPNIGIHDHPVQVT